MAIEVKNLAMHSEKTSQRSIGINLNHLWARIILVSLRGIGVVHYYVSPGYRNVPFITQLQTQDGLSVVSCIDERAAAFRAVGYIKRTGLPAALICTSGTAGANYYPGVIEASQQGLPLLILTCDRPFELVGSGSNQAIDQQRLFGVFVKHYQPLPSPSQRTDGSVIFQLIRAWVSQGVQFPPGPVHCNVAFAEPLEAADEEESRLQEVEDVLTTDKDGYDLALQKRVLTPNPNEMNRLAHLIKKKQRGLLVIGQVGEDAVTGLNRLIRQLQWPVYADVTMASFMQREGLVVFEPRPGPVLEALIQYDPECVLHFGKKLVSKWMDLYLKNHFNGCYFICSSQGKFQDPSFQVVQCIDADERAVVEKLSSGYDQALQNDCHRVVPFQKKMAEWARGESRDIESHRALSFSQIAWDVFWQIPSGSDLFIGNSLAIRVFDQVIDLVNQLEKKIHIHANRGVSGIDGLVATSLGIADGSNGPVTAVIGDISAIHDLNSLLYLAHAPVQIITIIINNSGGGIFRRLPIASGKGVHPLMSTPHSWHFKNIAAMGDLGYEAVRSRDQFQSCYQKMLTHHESGIIECLISDGS